MLNRSLKNLLRSGVFVLSQALILFVTSSHRYWGMAWTYLGMARPEQQLAINIIAGMG
jgi:hypothetical protein